MAVFNSYTATAGHQAMLYTNTPTSLTSVTSAYFTFWMYHDSGYSSNNDLVQTAVSTDGTTFYLTGNNFSRYSASAGWVLHHGRHQLLCRSGKAFRVHWAGGYQRLWERYPH